MKTNPNIFVGLGQPKCQLFFDLQAMIADNGGRLKLADMLEAEMVRSYTKAKTVRPDLTVWRKNEIDFILNNYSALSALSISEIIDRSVFSVRWKIHELTESGDLPYKNNATKK